MAIDLDWRLLTDSSANFGNALVGAAGQIRDRRERSRDSSALRNYLANPDDEEAFGGLAERDPRTAFALRDEHRQALASASAQEREELKLAGRLLRNVKDEAGYQQALAAGQRLGVDLTDVPPTFDPGWVQGALAAADALEAPQAVEEYTLGRGEVRYRGGQEIARGAAPPDQVVAVAPGGRAEVISPQWPGSSAPQAAPTIAVNPQTGEQVMFNPQTGQWEPYAGGGVGDDTGGFRP